MLVIRRGRGDAVLIGSEVEVRILDIAAGQVKIGIEAPRRIPVLRKEIALTAEANRAAARAASSDALAGLLARLPRGPGPSYPLVKKP